MVEQFCRSFSVSESNIGHGSRTTAVLLHGDSGTVWRQRLETALETAGRFFCLLPGVSEKPNPTPSVICRAVPVSAKPANRCKQPANCKLFAIVICSTARICCSIRRKWRKPLTGWKRAEKSAVSVERPSKFGGAYL